MNFRVLSRFFAWFDLIMSIIFLGLILFWGIKLLLATVFQSLLPSELSNFPLWMVFGIFLFYCTVNVIANRRLLEATKKGTDPQTAIDLSDVWWFLALISIIIGAVRFVLMAVTHQKSAMVYMEGDDEKINWRYFLDLGFLSLHGLGLFCVYKFRKEMKSTLPHSVMETHLLTSARDQNPTNANLTHQSPQLPPPSYETVKSSEIYHPPPPYDQSFGPPAYHL